VVPVLQLFLNVVLVIDPSPEVVPVLEPFYKLIQVLVNCSLLSSFSQHASKAPSLFPAILGKYCYLGG